MKVSILVVYVLAVASISGCGGGTDSEVDDINPSSINDVDLGDLDVDPDNQTSDEGDDVIRAFDFLHGVELQCRNLILNISGDSSLARCPNCGIIPDATYYSERLADGSLVREGTWHLDDFWGYPTIELHRSGGSLGPTYRLTDDGLGIRVREFHDRPTAECRPI